MKTCIKCHQSKALAEYYRHKRSADGHLAQCKTCVVEARSKWTHKQKEASRRSKAKHKAKIRAIPLSDRPIPLSQKCRRCKIEKPVEHFGIRLAIRNGRETRCLLCVNEAQRERYASQDSFRVRLKQAQDKYRKTERGQIAELDWLFRTKYGITAVDYFAMSAAQGGRCALCLAVPSVSRRLAVDHDHVTGLVRGLLCGKCNSALERFDSIPDFASRVTQYLNNPKFDQIVASHDVVTTSEAVN